MLRKYISSNKQEDEDGRSGHVKPMGEPYETSILGDFNTITGGFAGGGPTRSARKRYARNIMTTITIEVVTPTPILTFFGQDMKDVCPHKDDPVVLSVIIMGSNAHRVLIDQGSSIDVMF